MSKNVVKTGKERAKEILPRVDTELFKKLITDFFELRAKRIIVLDLLPHTLTMAYSEEILENLTKKYSISKETFSEIIEVLSNVLNGLLEDSVESFTQQLADEKLGAVFKNLTTFVNSTEQFSKIRDRYLVVKYCKTRYLGEIDWEISLKDSQKQAGGEKEAPVIPFCVARLCFQSPHSREKGITQREPEIVTVELSLSDVTQLNETFSEIGERMRKVITRKLTGCEK